MIVQEINVDNKLRYFLIDENGEVNKEVSKYLKHLDNVGRKSNTLKTYCKTLKKYYEFLDEIGKKYDEVEFQDLSDFVGWLRQNRENVVYLQEDKNKTLSNKTVNLTVNVVVSFYDYLYREEMMGQKITSALFKKTKNYNGYKDFLEHIKSNEKQVKNILKLKVKKQKVKILTKQQVKKLIDACSNSRDKFLMQLLYETGFRIGEVLTLQIEDFEMDYIEGHKIHLRDRGDLENGASLKTGERTINISDSLMEKFDDYLVEYLDDIETDYVFIKLNGANKGRPMNYEDVNSLMKRLKKKTGIEVTAHMFRHTHASQFYRETRNIKAVQERLGHADIQTTMNLYVHSTEEQRREEWEKAQETFLIKEGVNYEE